MTLHSALLQGAKLLEDAGVAAPRLTAEVLLSHAIGRDRVYLYAHPEDELSELGWIHYGRYLHERIGGKPTQYITKRQEFYGREFAVGPDVLIPRPETEHLVEAAIAKIRPVDTVLDVGTGSGAIATTLALETQSRIFASDVSIPALRVAAANARRLEAAITLVACDLASCFEPRSIDVLVSNPPYVPQTDQSVLQREVREHEPPVALFAGPSGLEIYERLIEQARTVVRTGGWLLVELGYNSLGPVRDMLGTEWINVEVRSDLAGLPRVLEAQHAASCKIRS
jgi:release factor glutamine methyltransferase